MKIIVFTKSILPILQSIDKNVTTKPVGNTDLLYGYIDEKELNYLLLTVGKDQFVIHDDESLTKNRNKVPSMGAKFNFATLVRFLD